MSLYTSFHEVKFKPRQHMPILWGSNLLNHYSTFWKTRTLSKVVWKTTPLRKELSLTNLQKNLPCCLEVPVQSSRHGRCATTPPNEAPQLEL
jgi:hypothetical protein